MIQPWNDSEDIQKIFLLDFHNCPKFQTQLVINLFQMSAENSFEEFWLEAVAKYEKSTNRKLTHDSVFSRLRTVEDLQTEVENEEQRFKDFRTEHRKVYSVLAKCFRPIQDLVKVVQAGLGSTPYAPAVIVLGAASYLLKVSAETM